MSTPLTAQQLFDAIKREGVDVREYKSWRTHGRDAATGKTFGPVHGVVMHHTAGRDSLALVYNGMPDLPGPLCHTHLAKTGVASMISAHRANHAGTFAQNAHNAVLAESPVHPYPDAAEPVDGNDSYYGMEIENLGDGNDPYTLVQYRAAVKWATAICRAHGWSHDSVIGHKEGTRRKIDPKGPVTGGPLFTMDRFRADVKDALALPAGVWPNQQEEEDMTPEQDARLKRVEDALADLKEFVRVAPWTYKNADVNGDSDTYKLLTDVDKGVKSFTATKLTATQVTAIAKAVGDELRTRLDS